MQAITVFADALKVFNSREDWLQDSVKAWISGLPEGEKVICVCRDGSCCNTAAHFKMAEDKKLYPVTAYRLMKAGETSV